MSGSISNPGGGSDADEVLVEEGRSRSGSRRCCLAMLTSAGPAFAQKRGGILRMYSLDSPASMSIHEEATVFAQGPMMGVFNNLVMYDQHVPQNSLQSI